MAFFFILFLNFAISHSVRRIQGACLLPGLGSGGGGVSSDSALLVDIPATELCTFVPTAPGGRGARGTLGIFNFGTFGGFGGFIRAGLRDPPTRDVGIGMGDGGTDSQSESVNGSGESGFGGGSTSPGTVILRLRYRFSGLAEDLPADAAALAPSSRRVIRGGGVLRAAWGDLGTGVGSLEGGFGKARSLVMILVKRL